MHADMGPRESTEELMHNLTPLGRARMCSDSSDMVGDHGLEILRGSCRRSVDLESEVAAELRIRSGDTAVPGSPVPGNKIKKVFPSSII